MSQRITLKSSDVWTEALTSDGVFNRVDTNNNNKKRMREEKQQKKVDRTNRDRARVQAARPVAEIALESVAAGDCESLLQFDLTTLCALAVHLLPAAKLTNATKETIANTLQAESAATRHAIAAGQRV